MAENSILLIVARLLWAFDLVAGSDSDGKDVTPNADPLTAYDNNVMACVKPFPVKFKLRSEERGNIIRKAYQQALEVWENENLDLYRESIAGK